MTLAQLKLFFRQKIKVVSGGPTNVTRGEDVIASFDALAEYANSGEGTAFNPLLTTDVAADKQSYSGLELRPLLIRIVGALGGTVLANAQPAAPTQGQVNDTGDTFRFLANPAFPSFAQYKVNGLPGVSGPVFLDAVNSYTESGFIYIRVVGPVLAGNLAVYVAGSGNTPDGKVLTNAQAFTGVATPPASSAPTLTSFNPASAAVGATVTLSGTNLTGATGVSFNGSAANFTVLNATTINATVPAAATSGPIGVSTAAGGANSPTGFVVSAATAGTYVVLFEGHSRIADERPRFYYPGGLGPYAGTVNSAPVRVRTALAGNSAYVFPTLNGADNYNFATSGDEIRADTGMLNPAALTEVESGLVAGKINILVLHHYINNIHERMSAGAAVVDAVAYTKTAIQNYITAIKARADAKGAALRFVQVTEPSTYPPAFTDTQATNAESCVVQVRDWLLANRAALGILVIADAYSDSRFAGKATTSSSPFYRDQVHYSPAGDEFMAASMIVPAILQAAANNPTVIVSSYVAPVGADDGQYATATLTPTTFEDNSARSLYTGHQASSIATAAGDGYSNNTARLTNGPTGLPLAVTVGITARFSGGAGESVELYGYHGQASRWRSSLNNGTTWSAYTNFQNATPGLFATVAGLPKNAQTVLVEISNQDGTALTYGNHNHDKMVVNSRVPLGAGDPSTTTNDSQYSTSALVTTAVEDASPALVYAGHLASSNTVDAAAGYSANSVRFTQGPTGLPLTASVKITARFSGTAEEQLRLFGYYAQPMKVRYKIGTAAFVDLPNVQTAGPTPQLFATVPMATNVGPKEILIEWSRVDGTVITYGDANFDYLQVLTRVPVGAA